MKVQSLFKGMAIAVGLGGLCGTAIASTVNVDLDEEPYSGKCKQL